MVVVLPREGDPLLSATAIWPADREQVEVGVLRIASVAPAGEPGECDPVMFNPTLLPAGIEPSQDPMLLIRAPAYAVSLSRRLQ